MSSIAAGGVICGRCFAGSIMVNGGSPLSRLTTPPTIQGAPPLRAVEQITGAVATGRRPGLRELRLFTGLSLGLFLLTHFTNHALGLISLEAMQAWHPWFHALWRTLPGKALLYGSLLTHFLLALVALYRRHTLRMPFREAIQMAAGFALPFMLIPHVTGTRLDFFLTGNGVSYHDVILGFWVIAPQAGLMQSAALLLAWLHVCLGLWYWLRGRSWFARYGIVLYTIALLVPVLALLGFAEAGKEIAASYSGGPGPASPAKNARLAPYRMGLYLGLAGAIAAVFAARLFRLLRHRARSIRVEYPGGRILRLQPGFSILEGSRMGRIAHLSTCGGRGRCSTCRVKISSGHRDLPPAGPQEIATLRRIRAASDVRLACQLRPTHDLAVTPVLSAAPSWTPEAPRATLVESHEREVAVLFCDLRGFTRFSERRLPFDTVFVLNRYFEVVGAAVESCGGYLDKFIGDGALALFGLQSEPDAACRDALRAARLIAEGLAEMNQQLRQDLGEPLRIAMGLHAGPAIIGEMGYQRSANLTAIGDTINTASRLEGIAKEQNAELVVSAHLVAMAGLDFSGRDKQRFDVRGRTAALEAWIIPAVRGLEVG